MESEQAVLNRKRYRKYETIRDAKGFKDSDVAAGAGIAQSTISDWKSGRITPAFGNIVRISNFLGVSANEFECQEAGEPAK